METKLLTYSGGKIRSYKKFRLSLMGSKDFILISMDDREKIVTALNKGAKYISLGNIFFQASSISSILPISRVTDEVVYEPNRLLKK